MMLFWNTVSGELQRSLRLLMAANELEEFRLVGGTALSLHLGHRMSDDIDLFTDAPYRSVDFGAIEAFLKTAFPYVQGDFGGNPGMGKSYLVGFHPSAWIKLDCYYSQDPFFQSLYLEDDIRMASIEEIVAMKIDVVQRGGRKKDFWDLHELLGKFAIADMIALHRQRFEWTHDPATIIRNFSDFDRADGDFDPVCLRDKQWLFVKEDIDDAVQGFQHNNL